MSMNCRLLKRQRHITYFVADIVSKHEIACDANDGVNGGGNSKSPVDHVIELRRVYHVFSQGRNDCMPGELSSYADEHTGCCMERHLLTPAMNRPKDSPSSPTPAKERLVCAGSHKLPGASVLERPSMNMTATKNSVDKIPKMDAYERTDKGMSTVGIRLAV